MGGRQETPHVADGTTLYCQCQLISCHKRSKKRRTDFYILGTTGDMGSIHTFAARAPLVFQVSYLSQVQCNFKHIRLSVKECCRITLTECLSGGCECDCAAKTLGTSQWKKKFAACQSFVHVLRELCACGCAFVCSVMVCVCLCVKERDGLVCLL